MSDRRKLAELKARRAALERLNRKVREQPGETTRLMVQHMTKIGNELIAVKRQIEALEDKY